MYKSSGPGEKTGPFADHEEKISSMEHGKGMHPYTKLQQYRDCGTGRQRQLKWCGTVKRCVSIKSCVNCESHLFCLVPCREICCKVLPVSFFLFTNHVAGFASWSETFNSCAWVHTALFFYCVDFHPCLYLQCDV